MPAAASTSSSAATPEPPRNNARDPFHLQRMAPASSRRFCGRRADGHGPERTAPCAIIRVCPHRCRADAILPAAPRRLIANVPRRSCPCPARPSALNDAATFRAVPAGRRHARSGLHRHRHAVQGHRPLHLRPGLTAAPPAPRARSPTSTATQGVLLYRGYPIEQLAEKSNFLEVAYLLLNGELPNKPRSSARSSTTSRITR